MEQALLQAEQEMKYLEQYREEICTYASADAQSILKMPSEIGCNLVGMVKNLSVKYTRNDHKEFAVFQIQDFSGTIECVCYNREFLKCKDYLQNGNIVYVRALTKKNSELAASTLVLNEAAVLIEQAVVQRTDEIHLHLHEQNFEQGIFDRLTEIIQKYQGNTPVILCIETVEKTVAFIETSLRYSVSVSRELLNELETLLGSNCYRLKANMEVPQPRVRREWKKEDDDE